MLLLAMMLWTGPACLAGATRHGGTEERDVTEHLTAESKHICCVCPGETDTGTEEITLPAASRCDSLGHRCYKKAETYHSDCRV